MVVGRGIQHDVVASDPELVGPELYRLWYENLALRTPPEAHFQRLYRDAPEPTSTVFPLRARAHGPPRTARSPCGVDEAAWPANHARPR